MAKFTLEFEDVFDFKLIGIFSHVKDYRLCWEINKALSFDFQKSENLTITFKGNNQRYSFFEYTNEEDMLDYYLIANRSEYGTLIPEEKCDYFLLIKGIIKDRAFELLIKRIKELNLVLATAEIEVEQLKSKENLIF